MQSYINVRLDGSGKGDSGRRKKKASHLPTLTYRVGVGVNQEEEGQDDQAGGGHGKFQTWMRKAFAFLFSQVGVGALLLLYTLLGAVLFLHLESAPDSILSQSVGKLRAQTVSTLWNVTSNYNVLEVDKWRGEVDEVVRAYQAGLLSFVKKGYAGGERERVWTFPKALMYSLSVYTTIGYGNLTPKTDWGKVMTCLYAVFGIPLLLLYMANTGDLFANGLMEIYTYAERCRAKVAEQRRQRLGKEMSSNLAAGTNERTIPISTCLSLFSLYIGFGAVIFSLWEGWNYLDGSYFCFISLVTIGLGDLVPGHTLGEEAEVDTQLILCSVYILFGMGLMRWELGRRFVKKLARGESTDFLCWAK